MIVTQVACGAFSTVFCTLSGKAYVCSEEENYPYMVAGLEDQHVTGVACGCSHYLALTQPRANSSTASRPRVYAWGVSCGYGELGTPERTRDIYQPPRRIEFPEDVVPVQIAAGTYHSLVRDNVGSVWGFGCGLDARLGPSRTSLLCCPLPEKISFGPSLDRFNFVGAGRNASVFITTTGAFVGSGPIFNSPGLLWTYLKFPSVAIHAAVGVTHYGIALADGRLIMGGLTADCRLGVQPGTRPRIPPCVSNPPGMDSHMPPDTFYHVELPGLVSFVACGFHHTNCVLLPCQPVTTGTS
ncbi:hypothetical protein Pelo_18408 [Pelomyxa schiedti]|nr:hypothetical protein Pelo_18408 [Pelomyxa schiedti]